MKLSEYTAIGRAKKMGYMKGKREFGTTKVILKVAIKCLLPRDIISVFSITFTGHSKGTENIRIYLETLLIFRSMNTRIIKLKFISKKKYIYFDILFTWYFFIFYLHFFDNFTPTLSIFISSVERALPSRLKLSAFHHLSFIRISYL